MCLMVLTFKTMAQEMERNLQSIWMLLNVQVQPSSSHRSVTRSRHAGPCRAARVALPNPQTRRGGISRNLLICLNMALLQKQLHDVLGLEKLSPSSPKLGRSQRLSPSVVTLEHLVACCQSPDELFLFTFLESDSLHLVY